MAQMGFFDVEKRYAALDAKNDPLVKINAVVPWEAFRSRLEKVWRKPADKRKSNAGCKPWDAIVMFKAIVSVCPLQSVGRSGGVPEARPPLLCALPGSGPWRQSARRQDRVAVPGRVVTGWCDRRLVQ